MNIRPLVSVIIPVYNGEEFVSDCLGSVFAQTLQGVQVICVNDGSTDRSGEILAAYQQQHPDMIIVTQENGGLSAARNAGIEKASGEYIDFLDCDDMLRPNALEVLYNRAHQNALDMLLYDGDTVYASEDLRRSNPGYETLYHTKVKLGTEPMTGEALFVCLTDGESYRATACMYLLRLDYVRCQGFRFIPGIYYEDNVFTIQCLLGAERCSLEPTPFYLRSLRGESIVTSHKNYRHARSYYICETEIQHYLLTHSLGAETIRCANKQINALHRQAVNAYAALSNEERKKAKEEFPDAILIDGMLNTGMPMRNESKSENKKTLSQPKWLDKKLMNQYTAIPYQPDTPFISVILPVYNAAEYLKETIGDLQAQTLHNIEMLFVDDGSTDGSAEMIEKYAASDPRIHLFRQQNQFAGVARNNGMDHAKGEYLLFLDSDDRFSPELAACTYACAKHEDAQVVIFHADLLRMPNREYVPAQYLCPCNRLPEKVFSAKEARDHIFDVLNPWTKLYRRSYIESLGVRYQALFSSNDLYFTMIAMSCAERIMPLPKVLVHYRVGMSTNIQSKKSKAPLDVFQAFTAVKETLMEKGTYEEFRLPYAVKAAESMLRSLDTMTSLEGYRVLYDALHNGGFSFMDLDIVAPSDMNHIANGIIKLARCQAIRDTDYDSYVLDILSGKAPSTIFQSAASFAGMRDIALLREENIALRNSNAYRIGSVITKPLHILKVLFNQIRH